MIRSLTTGEAKVVVTFSVAELESIAISVGDLVVRERVLQAIGLLNTELETSLRMEFALCAR
jgi:hypothetical protein